MKKLVILATVISLLLLSLAGAVGCRQQAEPAPPLPTPAPTPPPPPPEPPPLPEGALAYTNSEYGFSVLYPEDWSCEEGVMGTIVMFAGPFLKDEEFMINMNIMAEELPDFPKMTLEDYSKVGEMQMKQAFENYRSVEERPTTIADLPAIVRTYTWNYEGIKQMQTQAFFLKENVAYVVTYAATPKSHEQFCDCFEGVINSFKFE